MKITVNCHCMKSIFRDHLEFMASTTNHLENLFNFQNIGPIYIDNPKFFFTSEKCYLNGYT